MRVHDEPGITLIELLVALMVAAVVVAMVTISGAPNPERALRFDAERLAQLLSLAREEAQVRGAPIRFESDDTGFRFLIFFIGEFATAGVFAMIASTLFLGGWGVPFAWFGWDSVDSVSNWMNVVGPLIVITKMLFIVFLVMWARFSYPRFREDQLQKFAWKVLIPISLLNIMVTAVFKVVF